MKIENLRTIYSIAVYLAFHNRNLSDRNHDRNLYKKYAWLLIT